MFNFKQYIETNEPLSQLGTDDLGFFNVYSKKLKKGGIVTAGGDVFSSIKASSNYTQINDTQFEKLTDIQNAIIVTTYPGSPWLWPCLTSMEKIIYEYPIFLRINTPEENWYEIGGFDAARKIESEWFFLLHDTCIIKRLDLFSRVFNLPNSVALSPGFCMCLGKYYLPSIPRSLGMPGSKRAAVDTESTFNQSYMQNNIVTVLDMNFVDGSNFEEKNGRKNMILENSYIKKYKGHWSLDMC